MRFTDPQTCAFWRTHCQHCCAEVDALEVLCLDGECKRCCEKSLAMAKDCLEDPDGPVKDYPGYWWEAPRLYWNAPLMEWTSLDAHSEPPAHWNERE